MCEETSAQFSTRHVQEEVDGWSVDWCLFYSHGPIKPVELQDCSLPLMKERVKGLSEKDTIEGPNSAGLFWEDICIRTPGGYTQ